MQVRVRRRERRGDAVADIQSGDLVAALDEAPLSRFHLRAVVASGMGFFTDAYDLFVIGIASTLIAKEWNLSSGKLALLNSVMLAAQCVCFVAWFRLLCAAGEELPPFRRLSPEQVQAVERYNRELLETVRSLPGEISARQEGNRDTPLHRSRPR